MYDPFKFAHEQQFNLALIEKHLGGILKLDYNVQLNSLVAELDHNSRFPYLLLQILDLFTNFLIDLSPDVLEANETRANRTKRANKTKRNFTSPPSSVGGNKGGHLKADQLTGRRFKVNLQFHENKGLRFLYKNLANRVGNFFLLTCIVFCSSILLNQNLVLYFRRRSSIIERVKKMKRISSAIYWTGNLIADQLTGMLSWLGVLMIVLLLDWLNPTVVSGFMEFSIG